MGNDEEKSKKTMYKLRYYLAIGACVVAIGAMFTGYSLRRIDRRNSEILRCFDEISPYIAKFDGDSSCISNEDEKVFSRIMKPFNFWPWENRFNRDGYSKRLVQVLDSLKKDGLERKLEKNILDKFIPEVTQ
jgi:hypothetical protein